MAESELYDIFIDSFGALDNDNSGYIRAGEIEELLRVMQHVVGDKSQSILIVENKDSLIDYRHFTTIFLRHETSSTLD